MKLASQGNASAQYNLGVLYSNGGKIPRDYRQAMEWYMKAIEQGHATAQCNVGSMYYYGKGVPQDYQGAMEWFLKAADQGQADAQHNITSLLCITREQMLPRIIKRPWNGF